MALSYLKYKRKADGEYHFVADIGTNKFFRYQTGKNSRKIYGIEVLDEVEYRSPLYQRHVSDSQLLNTEFLLKIPGESINRESNFIQLVSYKTKDEKSPAVSEIINMKPYIAENSARLFSVHQTCNNETDMNNANVINQEMSFTQPQVSEAMFWGTIFNALPDVLKMAGPVISNLLGGKKSAASKQSNGSANVNTSKIIEAIGQLINQVSAKQKVENKPTNGASESKSLFSYGQAFNPAMLVQLAPLLQKVMSPETIKAIGDQPVKLFKAIGDAALKFDKQEMEHLERINPGVKDDTIVPILASMSVGNYSTATVAPALIAALPALMPVLKKLIDPKMIQAIGEQPIKLFKAVGDAALKLDKQETEHLEKINPGVKDETIVPLLESMSIPVLQKEKINFDFEPRVDLEFINTKTIVVGGVQKSVYSKKHTIQFPIKISSTSVSSPQKAISKVIVQAVIQDGDSMDLLVEKKLKLRNITLNSIINGITFSAEELKRLPLNKDLKVEVSFIWQSTKTGRNRGTFKNHYFELTNDYLFNQMGDLVSDPIRLNDITKFRPFWHKVWEGGLSESKRWEIAFQVKYFQTYNPESNSLVKMKTRKLITSDNAVGMDEVPNRRKIEARLKSGVEYNPVVLNQVLSMLSLPVLPHNKLEVLEQVQNNNQLNQVARIGVELKGKSGSTGALWAYPEMQKQKIHFLNTGEVNNLGQVVSVKDEVAEFIRPSAIFFIGTISEQ